MSGLCFLNKRACNYLLDKYFFEDNFLFMKYLDSINVGLSFSFNRAMRIIY